VRPLRPTYSLTAAPPIVQAVAAQRIMGSTFRVYEATPGPVGFPVSAGVWTSRAVASMALALVLTIGILIARNQYFLYFGGLVVLALFIVAVRMIARARRAIGSGGYIAPAGSRVYLFDSGLVHSGLVRDGNCIARAFLWNEVSVSVSRTFNWTYYLVARPWTSMWTSVQLSSRDWDVMDFEELGRAIIEKVKAVQVPQVLAAVRRGQQVSFGQLTVDRRGLLSSDGLTRWDRIESVSRAGGDVVVWKVGRFSGLDEYPAVSNEFVLEAVANTLIREAAHRG